jgi:hypothetical protein
MDEMEEWARGVVRIWRQRDPALEPDQVRTLRVEVDLALVQGILGYGGLLDAARAEIVESDDQLTDWLKDGAADDYRWALAYGAGRGPRVPDAAVNGDDGGWTPQGLGYDPATGNYYTTSYATNVGDPADGADDYDDSRLTVVDPRTGEIVSQVRLGGESGSPTGPQHAGGVAVHDGHVYVVGGGKLYDYDAAAIRDSERGAEVSPTRTIDDVGGTSYVTVAGGRIYLGNWGDDELHVYELDARGRPIRRTHQLLHTPSGANGVAVLPDGRLVFSVNHGRGDAGTLEAYTVDRNDLRYDGGVPVANLPEELVVVDGTIVGINESGASDYAPWDTDGRDRNGDHGDRDDGVQDTGGSEGTDLADFWARTHLFELPIGALDDSGPFGVGFTVEPMTLTKGAQQAYAAADGLDAVRTRLAGAHLPTSLLPQVPGARALGTAVDAALSSACADLRRLASATDRMGDELRATGDDYSATDVVSGLLVNLVLNRILG